mgnify:FL=1
MSTPAYEGSTIVSDGKEHISKAEKIDPIDTNGAGDMFAGGVLHKLSNGLDLEVSAKFGCFLASKGVENFGPRLSDQDYLKNKNLFV